MKVPASPRKRPAKPKERKPLRVPKGRLDTDPATLKKWLSRDDVRLVVDGYNVAKAENAYGDLKLESQRERLVSELWRLVKMTGTQTLVVFDAQKVPGRRAKTTKPPLTIEWSNEDQIADDYIVARLQERQLTVGVGGCVTGECMLDQVDQDRVEADRAGFEEAEAEAEEIAKNLFISALLLWPQPSAMFVGMEELDLLI